VTTAPQPEIWFLTGSQGLYGEDVLTQVADQSRQVSDRLGASPDIPAAVVAKPVLTDAAAIRSVMLAANADDACVGVIAWMHTFSPAKMWIAGLELLAKPFLHLHTQYNREIPWADIDMDFMNLNQAAHGDREFEFIAARLRLERKVVVGHWGDTAVQAEIGTWTRAACAKADWADGKIARFGDNMREVAVTDGDKVEAQRRLGFSVNTWGVGDLVAVVNDATDADVDDLVGQYLDEYDVAADLRPDGERRAELRVAARIEAGLRAFLEDGGFGAFTDTFEDLGELRQLPGIAVQRLMADGYGFGAEGDWKAGALVRILKVMAEGLPGGTSFMEDYTYHLGDPVPEVLGAHMLEVCPSIANGHVSCEIHPLSIGGRSDPVRLVFDAAPGPAVILGLADLGRRFRLISSTVDIVEPDAPLPLLPVARAVWRPRPDLATAAEAWLTAGGPHHTALTTAIPVEPIEDFAEIADIELVSIDAATTVPAFRKELRWNQAYYHLRGGI